MSKSSGVVASAGAAGVSVAVIGASATAASVGTIIVATGGAAALVLAGYALWKWSQSK
jgi:hypothetical protein